MKLHGQKIEGPNNVTIVIPRGDDNQIVFTAQAVLSYAKFDEACPAPNPRMKTLPGGGKMPLTEEPDFIKKLEEYGSLRMTWMVLQSLSATDGLEWETVQPDDPTTWANYETELREAGLSDIEVGRLIRGVMQANALDEEMIAAARERFLASQVVPESGSTPTAEQRPTSSGESASDSD